MNWFQHLSWSHAALLLLGSLAFLATIWAALHSGDPDYDVKDDPHHSCKRNSTESVGRYE